MKAVRVLMLLAIVAAPVAGSVGSASALLPQVTGTCGMTISQSVRLTNDLTCSGTYALFVTSSPLHTVTVDLGGHTMATDTPPAIAIFDGGGSVVLTDGRVVGGAEDAGGGGNSITTYHQVVFDGTGVSAFSDTTRLQTDWFAHGANVSGTATTWTISSNRFLGGSNGAAITIDGGSATIQNNMVTGYDTGIALTDANVNATVYENNIYGAITGINVGGGTSSNITGQIKSNHINYGRGDGVILGDGAGTLVQSNNARLNGGDGIHVVYGGGAPVAVTFTNNIADRNAGDGIDATSTDANVTIADGGGNRAIGNLGSQCLNLAC